MEQLPDVHPGDVLWMDRPALKEVWARAPKARIQRLHHVYDPIFAAMRVTSGV